MSQSSKSVFSNNDGNFKESQPQTASMASAPSATVNFNQNEDTRFKAAGTMIQSRPFAMIGGGAGPGMGPAPSFGNAMNSPVMFGGSNPMGMGQMPVGKGPQQGQVFQQGGKPDIRLIDREPSTEPAPAIRQSEVNWMRSIATTSTPDEAIGAMLTGLSDLNIRDYQQTDGFKIEGRYFSESHKMAEFYVGIYTVTEDRRTIVEINSSQGPVFQEFLTNIFSRLKILKLNDFETQVNVEQSYNWSPLPLPILGMDDMANETPSSPDVGGGLDMMAPPQMPMLGGFPPEISLSLGFSIDENAADPDVQKRSYLEDLIDSLENGFAREIADAAPNLAVESEDADAVRVLKSVDNVSQRLLDLISQRLDACLVRSAVITLGNLLQDDEFSSSISKEDVRNQLEGVATKWSAKQEAFVQGEFIPRSPAIVDQVGKALMHV